jgi:protein SCO1
MIITTPPERQGRVRCDVPRMRLAALAAACLALLPGCSAPSFNGVVFDPPESAPALRLRDSSGVAFDLAGQRGNVVLIFFGYTHCPDICPTTLADWKHVSDSLGTKREQVRFLFVSVDPERDLPAPVQRYAARFGAGFRGLTGTRAEIDTLLHAWKLAAYRDGVPTDTGASYLMAHPSQVFVVDRNGKLRLMHRAGLTVPQIAADIRSLL